MSVISAATDLITRLTAAPGLYRGRGDGPETGPFLARLTVGAAVRGRIVTIDYEATSDRDGLRHVEHSVLAAGENGRLELHVACLELPGVVRFTQVDPATQSVPRRGQGTGSGVTFASYGPVPARIVLALPGAGALSYAWWWSRDGGDLREQSRAEVHRTG